VLQYADSCSFTELARGSTSVRDCADFFENWKNFRAQARRENRKNRCIEKRRESFIKLENPHAQTHTVFFRKFEKFSHAGTA